MATVNQVIAQIRFQISQLSARNAHHEFEHLARHFARLRICSNILPATGPVAAGGDQARDFETFRTYLAASPLSGSTFLGLADQRTIAFCCSLEKSIKGKIKKDVQTIAGSGSAVEAVYYFCAEDLAVAARHELQAWAREEHSTHLEILDGAAISEQLSDPDLFWVAEQYLQIPREIYPDRPAPEKWYAETKSRWQGEDALLTPAEFFGVKSAARYALTEAQEDVGFWLRILHAFEESSITPPVKRWAAYEIAVLCLRSGRTLEEHGDRLRGYFEAIPTLDASDDLEDATNLLHFCVGAKRLGQLDIDSTEIPAWWSALQERLLDRLQNGGTPSRRAVLLQILGNLSLSHIGPGGDSNLDIDAAMKHWIDALGAIRNAPLFPLERFATFITAFAEALGDHPEYGRLTSELDELLSERTGGYSAASNARYRAIAFHNNGRITRAINELHSAKIKWYSDETIKGGVLSLLLLADWYSELGLNFAAKYHALAAIHVIAASGKAEVTRLRPPALGALATFDYELGNWFDAIATSRLALGRHLVDSISPEKLDQHPGMEPCFFHAGLILGIGEILDRELADRVAAHLRDCPFSDSITELAQRASSKWGEPGAFDLWTRLEEEFCNRPFADAEPTRVARWSALGITWRFTWENAFDTHQLAEYFIATLQIFLCDLAGEDLCLLPTAVEVEISRGPTFRVVSEPSNATRRWRFQVPDSLRPYDDSEGGAGSVVGTLGMLLSEVSVLKSNDLLVVIEGRFKEGLNHKMLARLPYPRLYRSVMPKETFESFPRTGQNHLPRDRIFKLSDPDDLRWISAPGPGYSREHAEQGLRNRYSSYLPPVRLTVKRLARNPEFLRLADQLRKDGWLDWQILGAVCGVAINFRLTGNERTNRPQDQLQREFLKAIGQVETDSIRAVPLAQFTRDALQFNMDVIMLSSLTNLGLECHQRTPDLPAIRRFLGERYMYWTDDIPHPDIFGKR